MNRIKFLLLVMIFSLSAFVNADASKLKTNDRIIDEAEILDASEEKKLDEKLQKILDKNIDVVILTVKSLGSKTAEAYADDYYDENGYGIGADESGVLFLISEGDRKYHISTKGAGIRVFTDYGIGIIKDKVQPYLSKGKYYKACDKFLSVSDDFVDAYNSGKAYDIDKAYVTRTDYILVELIAFAISLGIGFVSIGIMSLRMNNAKPQKYAGEYVRNFKLTNQSDMFMYSNVKRTVRQITDSSNSHSSSGGSTTHTSSSGSTHGGGGGSF